MPQSTARSAAPLPGGALAAAREDPPAVVVSFDALWTLFSPLTQTPAGAYSELLSAAEALAEGRDPSEGAAGGGRRVIPRPERLRLIRDAFGLAGAAAPPAGNPPLEFSAAERMRMLRLVARRTREADPAALGRGFSAAYKTEAAKVKAGRMHGTVGLPQGRAVPLFWASVLRATLFEGTGAVAQCVGGCGPAGEEKAVEGACPALEADSAPFSRETAAVMVSQLDWANDLDAAHRLFDEAVGHPLFRLYATAAPFALGPGAFAAVEAARHHPRVAAVCIVSNYDERVRGVLSTFGFACPAPGEVWRESPASPAQAMGMQQAAPWFNAVLSLDDVRQGKPFPDGLEAAATMLVKSGVVAEPEVVPPVVEAKSDFSGCHPSPFDLTHRRFPFAQWVHVGDSTEDGAASSAVGARWVRCSKETGATVAPLLQAIDEAANMSD